MDEEACYWEDGLIVLSLRGLGVVGMVDRWGWIWIWI